MEKPTKATCYVMYEKVNGLVGIQERYCKEEELEDYLYVKDTAFKKTDKHRFYEGKKALVYVEIE